MKTMKKIFALALAMMMVFSLALSANAVNLDVEGALEGATYELYKMATVTVEASGASVYTAEEAWEAFFKDLDWIEILAEEPMKFVRNGDPTEAVKVADAKAAKAYAAENGIESATATAADGEASFTNVDQGYYLMTSDKGSLCTLATITNDSTIKEKNETLPQIEKTVENAKNANAAIGETVEFTLTVTTGENHNNEMEYVIHDQMSEGLTLDEDSIVVKYGEKVLTEGTDYEIKTAGLDDDSCTFEIIFKDTLTTAANDTITVTYNAVVNGEAGTTETNNAKIDLDESNVTVTTTGFELIKKDGEGKALAGAEFELYIGTTTGEGTDAVTAYTKVPVVLDGNAYRPAVTDEEKENETPIVAGTATVKGLDLDKTYYVKETKAPDGYVMIDDYKAVTGTKVTVENVKGDELPETGGMGTTLFYTLGGLMVAAAAVLLITKKRMSAM